jgi:phospholipase/lecithinase/hemolysin
MRTTASGNGELRRAVQAALFALLTVLLVSACGSGSDTPPPQSGGMPQQATAEDAEWLAAANDVAAPGGDAALAVEALQAAPADGLGFAPRTRQVVVFGDSLSDVGTYKVGAIAQVGGGKFTTNPGPVWPETLGILLRARVTPYRQGFDGVTQILGGTGFAMGGARVSQQPGIGCNPDASGRCTAALTIPVTQQVADYLAGNGDRFSRDQLVFLFAGANDIFYQLGVFQAKVTAGVPIPQAQDEALAAVQQAALELVGQARLILGKGATRVVVLNLPEISETPFGNAPETAPVRPLIAGMVQMFNGTLAAGLQGSGANLFDLHAEFLRVIGNPGAYWVREINVPACDPAKISAITNGLEQGGSSLFCSRLTLVQNGAAVTYLFADSVHPTTLGHLIFARFVLIELWKNRLF